jgi:Family of unknown function (DUF5996)
MTDAWPPLPLEEWVDTRETLHMWTQVVGKVKLELCPFVNQWWEVAFALSSRGLTTGVIPAGDRSFQVSFDLLDDRLSIEVSDGSQRSMALEPRSVADFYAEFIDSLRSLDIDVEINPLPSEVPDPVRFDHDTANASYDSDVVRRWWGAMLSVERVIQRFRTGFAGKSSPVLFYWGGFDLSHTRFNGRLIAQDPSIDPIMRFGENEENFAVGFWPGSRQSPYPALYAYVAPAPDGLAEMPVEPPGAHFDERLGELVLPYDVAREQADPDDAAFAFFDSAYRGSVALAGWDLERLREDTPDRHGKRGS